MFQTKVIKDVLLGRIKEEISKLEDEWGEDLYKQDSHNLEITLDFHKLSERCHYQQDQIDLEYDRKSYNNTCERLKIIAQIEAVKRKDKLLRISGLVNLCEDDIVSVDEGTYDFLYNMELVNIPQFAPFEETVIYKYYTQPDWVAEVLSCKCDTCEIKPPEACGPNNTSTKYDTTKPLEPRVISDGVDMQFIKILLFLLVVCIFVIGLLYVLN